MTRISMKSLLAIAAVLVAVVGLGAAAASQDDGRNDTRARIEKKIISGDDIQAIKREHAIFFSQDGHSLEFKGGDGAGLEWVFEGEGDEAGMMKMMFLGGDGVILDLEGHDGESFSWTSADGGNHSFGLHEMSSGGFLGVGTTELTPELRRHFGVPEDTGVMVSNVVDDSGAFRAGVRVGDIVTAVDSQPISSARSLQRAIRKHEEGDSVTLELWRDGRVQDLTAIVGKTEGVAMRRLHFSADSLHGSLGRLHRAIKMSCDDDASDCEMSFGGASALCGDQEECKVIVSCEDDACTCEVNGVESDCEDLEGIHVRHHD